MSSDDLEQELRTVRARGLALAQGREERLAERRTRQRGPVTPWQSYMRKIDLRPDGVWLNEQWLRSLLDPFDGQLWEELMERSGAQVRQASGTRWLRAHTVAAFLDTGAFGRNFVKRLRIFTVSEAAGFGDEVRCARISRDKHLVDQWLDKVFLSQIEKQFHRHDSMVEKIEVDFDYEPTASFQKELVKALPLEFGVVQHVGTEVPEVLLWIRKLPAAIPGQ